MVYTLLDLVQTILSSLDGEEVDSISDNTESLQVAYIVRDTYNDIVSRLELPNQFNYFQLTASGDSSKPTIMYLPSNVKSVESIQYNCVDTDAGETSPRYVTMDFEPLDVFEAHMAMLNSDNQDNVIDFDHTISGLGTFSFLCVNDRMPTKYTTWDDHTLVFDSYDADNDSTLQSSKTKGYGELSFDFTMDDDFTFPIDDRQYSLLLNEAKTQAFAELKQTQNVVSAQRARKAWITNQNLKKKNKPKRYQDLDLPNYGWRR